MEECKLMHWWTHDGSWLVGRVGKDRKLYSWLDVDTRSDCCRRKSCYIVLEDERLRGNLPYCLVINSYRGFGGACGGVRWRNSGSRFKCGDALTQKQSLLDPNETISPHIVDF